MGGERRRMDGWLDNNATCFTFSCAVVFLFAIFSRESLICLPQHWDLPQLDSQNKLNHLLHDKQLEKSLYWHIEGFKEFLSDKQGINEVQKQRWGLKEPKVRNEKRNLMGLAVAEHSLFHWNNGARKWREEKEKKQSEWKECRPLGWGEPWKALLRGEVKGQGLALLRPDRGGRGNRTTQAG